MIFKPLSKNGFSINNFGKSQYKIQFKDDELNTGNELIYLYTKTTENKEKKNKLWETQSGDGRNRFLLKKSEKNRL